VWNGLGLCSDLFGLPRISAVPSKAILAGPAPPKRLVTSLGSGSAFSAGSRLHATVTRMQAAEMILWQEEAMILWQEVWSHSTQFTQAPSLAARPWPPKTRSFFCHFGGLNSENLGNFELLGNLKLVYLIVV